ncbi:FAD/NAD(P)-binding domain-containing protein [Hypoxylon trugodes]|uniref:FAD/NAD(P)-binding domain-containing protein n=1 Tax=Hypoxylon trugodes TaxID=326681 RepID=UPI0021930913|nr:FAD/NAD(P)-binding domain-containing protein [Hypoxylon trugodes]KAI1386146.1 FAD/NAD(P)-binding domain-containing protein [Hypoxylon trugodes]
MAKLKVLVSGAGIAGGALAFWLVKLGHDVTVVEKHPGLRATGLQIDLRGHGIQVLKLMGLEDDFRARMAPEQGMQVVNSAGKPQAYFPANNTGEGPQNFTTDYEIMRGDLCRLFYDNTKHSAKYIFGASIESFEEKDDGIEVRLSDGTTDRFDLVVGADGQGSRTRRLMLGSDRTERLHLFPLPNFYAGYFTTPRPMKEGEEFNATGYTATGRRAIMMRRHSPDEVQIYLIVRRESPRLDKTARGDVKEEKDAFAEIFRGAGWEADNIVKAMYEADDFYLERMVLVRLDAWSEGRVVLLGDAAYCPTATTGMGTTAALVGAFVLAGEISKQFNADSEVNGSNKEALASALKAYDQTFRPFIDQIQEGIVEGANRWGHLLPTSAWGITILNFILWVVATLRLDLYAQYFTKEKVKWDVPDYPDMVRK